ncbi:MAG: T9SS type A sorting domain-containing protein, partial [Flavobacteriaceae bacterium]
MKKITLLLTLLAFTFSFAQSIPVNFDADITVGTKSGGTVTPADANWFSDSGLASVAVENLAADTPDHGNAGKIVSSSSGQKWQNAQLLMKNNYIDLTSNKIISLDVYSDNAQDFLLKMEQPKDGTTGNTEKSFSHGGTGWESFSVDFNTPNSGQPVPNDQYKLFVIFPCYSAGFVDPAFDSTTYIDNFSGTVGDAITPPAVPTTDAPTPTHASADVISIYSDAYTDISGVNFNPNWGQSTLVNTSYDPTGGGSNTVIEYSNLNYQGTEFPTTDVSAMTHVHLDVWSPTGSSIQFTPISPGNELLQTVTTTKEDWKSVDIALSNFTNVVLTDVFQLKVVGTGTVYLDNIYFHKPPTAGIDDNVFNSIKMFPNPAKDVVQFSKHSNEQLDIQIFDMLGKSLMAVKNVQSEVNISSLRTGVYVV